MNRREFLSTGAAITGATLLARISDPLLAATTAVVPSDSTHAHVGAEMPWTTYQAEEMKTTGKVLGPRYDPFLVETESSGQRCVKLTAPGEYVEFTARSHANAMVVRYCLPDSSDGRGINSALGLYQNGKLLKEVPIT